MWYLRACPRCRGDLHVDQKPGEEQAMVCLQCGHDFTPRVAIREWIQLAEQARDTSAQTRKRSRVASPVTT
jgi:uncharacterized protein YbaR (Trm112 family)